MVGGFMDDKLEGIWKETVLPQSSYYPRIYLKILRNPTKTYEIAGVLSGKGKS
jgi:hypothetical protein